MRSTKLVCLILCLLLAGCGFQLRGSYALPFTTLGIALDPRSEFYAVLRRTIETASATRVVAEADKPEATLRILNDNKQKIILTLNAAGSAREYQLVRQFDFRVHDPQQRDFIPPSQIVIRREITFSDDLILSKEAEEELIWRDVQTDLVQQLMRRLAAAKLRVGVDTPTP